MVLQSKAGLGTIGMRGCFVPLMVSCDPCCRCPSLRQHTAATDVHLLCAARGLTARMPPPGPLRRQRVQCGDCRYCTPLVHRIARAQDIARVCLRATLHTAISLRTSASLRTALAIWPRRPKVQRLNPRYATWLFRTDCCCGADRSGRKCRRSRYAGMAQRSDQCASMLTCYVFAAYRRT